MRSHRKLFDLAQGLTMFLAIHGVAASEPRLWRPGVSSTPTTTEIRQGQIFDQPLLPTREATQGENQALAQALEEFSHRPVRDDFSSLARFLAEHSDSAWSPALETQLGYEFYRVGRYSKAIAAWNHVWQMGKPMAEERAALLANRSGSELAMMYARLGRMPELRALLGDLNQRGERGKSPVAMRGASEGLWSMEHRPEVSFRCGPLALDRICFATDRAKAGNQLIRDSQSTTNGFSATQVAELSRRIGLNYQVAFRMPGAEVILPAVVHWKVGHYAALVAWDGALLRVDDPTFGNKAWLSDEALDDEASGYFLVRSGPLPAGWRAVSEPEANRVWGRGQTLLSDANATREDDEKNCKAGSSEGMAQWSIHLLLASLHIEDTPVGYAPPVGPPIYFTVSHDTADAQNLPSVPYSNIAPDWRINWLAYITDDPMNPAGDIQFAMVNGGTGIFTDYNPTNQNFNDLFYNSASLVRTGTNSYEVRYADGSKRIFDLPDLTVGGMRRIYMTSVIDPAGNAATIQFDYPGKIASITDAIGQKTKLHYDFSYTLSFPNPNDPNPPTLQETNLLLVTSVEDPFGRVARFQVDSTTNYICDEPVNPTCAWPLWAQLTNIIDCIGLSSKLVGTSNGLALVTPYGTTTFSSGSFNGLYRAYWIEVTHPNGEKERIEYSENSNVGIAAGEPLSIVPKGVPVGNYILYGRNTYYWDRKAYAEGYSPNDYTGARIYHWTHGLNYNTASPILESFKEPLENRVWFNYDGQVISGFAGTSDQPTKVARVMEDGTTQLYQYEYNRMRHPIRSIDPLGRTLTFGYAANNVDLTEVRQTRAGQNELLFTATYNGQHRPLTIAGADRQTNYCTYNARGQILSLTDARGAVTTLSYDTNGYLLSVDGPLPGTNDTTQFTYDNVGRVRTKTDQDGYTLTFGYDALDRMTNVTYPDGTFEQVTYDRLDPAVLQDRAGRQTKLTFDSLRQLSSVQDALGRVTRYQWCGCGGLGSVIDPMGRVTSWIRDLQGRVQSKVYADGSQVRYQYGTATGWLKSIRDEQNQVVNFDHNIDGSLRQKSYVNALIPTLSVKFTYDPNYLRMLTMEDGMGLTTFGYNSATGLPSLGAGELAFVDGPLANDTITFEYDELGRVSKRNINGIGVARSWDAAGRLQQLTNALGTFTIQWDGVSFRPSAVNYPNGQRSTYSYYSNLKDRLLNQITHLKPNTSLLSRFTYDYNAVQEITDWTQERAGANPIAYHFDNDDADQLTNGIGTQDGSTIASYAYVNDPSQNLTNQSESGTLRAFSYNALNQMISATNDSHPLRTYEWDAEHRLVGFNQGTHRTEFMYDGLDRRTGVVEKENGSIVSDRRYIWSGTELCEERDATGAIVLKRFFDRGVDARTGSDLPQGSYFFTRDHLWSVRDMSDSNGILRGQYSYSPFGVRQQLAGDLSADFGFTGHYFHGPSELNLGLFRAYDASLARWISRDPLEEEGGLNLYSYVEQNPLNWRDPLGLKIYFETPEAENAYYTALSHATAPQIVQLLLLKADPSIYIHVQPGDKKMSGFDDSAGAFSIPHEDINLSLCTSGKGRRGHGDQEKLKNWDVYYNNGMLKGQNLTLDVAIIHELVGHIDRAQDHANWRDEGPARQIHNEYLQHNGKPSFP